MVGSRIFWKVYVVFSSVELDRNDQLNTDDFTVAVFHLFKGQNESSWDRL